MGNINKKTVSLNGYNLTIESGLWAPRADGAVIVRYRDTVLLVTASFNSKDKDKKTFLPLTVDVVEKFYASGKIPGGFFKREGRPSVSSTLTARVIDRAIRPLFEKNFFMNTHIVVTILSYDGTINVSSLGILGASSSLLISPIPFNEPVAGISVDPSEKVLSLSSNDRSELLIAGIKDGIVMIECSCDEIQEEKIVQSIDLASREIEKLINFQKDFVKDFNIEKISNLNEDKANEVDLTSFEKRAEEIVNSDLIDRLILAKKLVDDTVLSFDEEDRLFIEERCNISIDRLFKDRLLKEGVRSDNRSTTEIRDIDIELDVLPKVHGSVLFSRGKTQSLGTITLGTINDQQIIDNLDDEFKKRFFLHYNFPPFSTGDAAFMKSPGRREIGHGNLAEKAISFVIPEKDEFPYTIRAVSDILSSDGSSSMATVCSASLSLMLAGVPIKSAVAGIAMGMVKRDSSYSILSDISAYEDKIGDMDFKVAGTKDGITALQMDIKVRNISIDIIKKALDQARDGRLEILDIMNNKIERSREDLNSSVPRYATMNIDSNQISSLIGSAGKNIKDIIEKTGSDIDIDESGLISIFSASQEKLLQTIDLIKISTFKPSIGDIVDAKVKKIISSGAFLELAKRTDGFLHISDISKRVGKRIDRIENYISEGEILTVKIIEIDSNNGRIKLSIVEG